MKMGEAAQLATAVAGVILFAPFLILHYFSLSSVTHHLIHPPSLSSHRRLIIGPNPSIISEYSSSVLLADWKVMVFHFNPSSATSSPTRFSCQFRDNSISPARPTLSPHTFICPLPRRLRGLQPFFSPVLIKSNSQVQKYSPEAFPRMLRWNRLVYESLSTDRDIVLFAKGINSWQGQNRAAKELNCVFYSSDMRDILYTTVVTSSSQEIFRCAHPPRNLFSNSRDPIFISLKLNADESSDPLPSVATYTKPSKSMANLSKKKICACTMVYNSAKFLPEWVKYHSSIGVEEFFLYDNGSEDRFESTVNRLRPNRFNISTRFWPWPKSQEAAFSHCAEVNRDRCEWMAYIDVDEFIFAPIWSDSVRPNRTMLDSVVSVKPEVGRVELGCYEFGPSGNKVHPKNGVMQGYTCRRQNEERHKSLVRLNAVHRSLMNSIHHFGLQTGFRQERVTWAHVNHYKYQAWDEFKAKFKRRASAYVPDWMDKVNPSSKDRTPGLGFEPVEPVGWAWKFCEVNDTQLKNVTGKWFRSGDLRNMR